MPVTINRPAQDLDFVVLRILDVLDVPETLAHDVDRLIRMGWRARNGHLNVRPAVQALGEPYDIFRRALAAAGVPAVGTLISWGRLTCGLQHYRTGEMTLEAAGYAAGYATGTDLSQAMKRLAGATTSEWVAAGGGYEELADALVATWRGP